MPANYEQQIVLGGDLHARPAGALAVADPGTDGQVAARVSRLLRPAPKLPFVAVALVIVGALLTWLRRAGSRLIAVSLGLVIGGAAGNIVDRITYGAVFDFLDFHVGEWHWPAFNLADSGITIGVILLLADGLLGGRRSSR